MHQCMDKSMDAGVDGRWMSYAELAKIRHIDKTSALRLALRHGWPRRKEVHDARMLSGRGSWPDDLQKTKSSGFAVA